MSCQKGRFTIPGESGCEALTLKMAEKWGADAIRDSDGTILSEDILNSNYKIYSTICLIRDHNEWATENPDKLQQTFLMAGPIMAVSNTLDIWLLKQFFQDQFKVNDSPEALKYWQVFDRTEGNEIPIESWDYCAATGIVTINKTIPFHEYSVNFLAYTIWEQISMYNHVTNHWNSEHLMPIDPIYPETRNFIRGWLKEWCETHPHTDVVRFTSMFYNFTWIWGESEKNRTLFSDWGSYDFTVSPYALTLFKKKYGYSLSSEDFINKGNFQATNMPATKHKRDWMNFINSFVVKYGKELVDVVHSYGKKAYVFYDDSWIGVEPWGKRFHQFGFDGLIKCAFSGFEARLCGDVNIPVHELRLHPYLFPVGLGGTPTFMEGGHPMEDARKYWINIRRGILRTSIQRIGLGGYLHLTEEFPDFQNYIEEIADDFRRIASYHDLGEPYILSPKVAVLHYWGKLRSWTCSGHFHETYMHVLIHIIEALSGMPFKVDFIDFDDVKDGKLKKYDVVINAGREGSAWSGGEQWRDSCIVSEVSRFVDNGGVFIGVQDPSAIEGFSHYFRMAAVLGIDKDAGEKVCHGKPCFELEKIDRLLPEGVRISAEKGIYLWDFNTKVLIESGGIPALTVHSFGKGIGIYLGGFSYSNANTRLLMNLILLSLNTNRTKLKMPENTLYITDNPDTECTYFPNSGVLVVINNSNIDQHTKIKTQNGTIEIIIPAFGQKEIVI